MKYLSRAHLERLEALKKEQLLLACVERLKNLSLGGAFPPNQKEHYAFAEHVYSVAQKYGMPHKRGVMALLLAWHLKGDALLSDPEVSRVLQDGSLSATQKSEFFEKYSLDTIATEEKE